MQNPTNSNIFIFFTNLQSLGHLYHYCTLQGHYSVLKQGTRIESITATLKKRAIMKLNLWITLPLSMICVLANAQGTASTTTTTATTATTTAAAPAATSTAAAPKKEEAPSVKYGLYMETNYTLQAVTQKDGSRSQGQDFSISPSMSYNDYNGSVFITYAQDLVDSKSSPGFFDPSFSLSRKGWKLNDLLTLSPSGSLILPMSDNSKNNVGLMYNVGGALSLSLNSKYLGLDSWKFSMSLGYNRNFTNFDTNASGTPNTAHRVRQRYNVGYSFTDALSLSTRFQFDSNYSTQNIVRNSFMHYQSLGYALNDNVEVSFTHTNSGSLLKPETYESNLKFFDDASSEYSVGVSLSL